MEIRTGISSMSCPGGGTTAQGPDGTGRAASGGWGGPDYASAGERSGLRAPPWSDARETKPAEILLHHGEGRVDARTDICSLAACCRRPLQAIRRSTVPHSWPSWPRSSRQPPIAGRHPPRDGTPAARPLQGPGSAHCRSLGYCRRHGQRPRLSRAGSRNRRAGCPEEGPSVARARVRGAP